MAAKKEAGPASAKQASSPAVAPDEPEIGLTELARGILSREIRPRVSDVRRLAEAVLAGDAGGKKKKKEKGGSKRKADAKERKLSKIPQPKNKAK